jgi:ABC-type multidrug transport system ATPase subunit
MNLPFQVELDETFTAQIKQFGMSIEQDSLSTGETKLINLSILTAYLKLIRTKKNINILFLGEVFSSIDIENIEKILNLLKSFANEYKINIFVVHHAMMNEELFDRILRIDKNVFTEIIEVELEKQMGNV